MSEHAAETTRVRDPASVVRGNPNATIALTSGSGLGAVVVWGFGMAGLAVPPEAGAAIGGLVAAAFLFLGRNGLVGAWHLLLHGARRGEPA